MPVGEAIGIALSACLLGVVLGTLLTLHRAFHRRRADDRIRRGDAFARWLAARQTLGRTSLSFVAAFRALREASSDSPYRSLRLEAAQHSRIQWCEAMRELETAEAALRTWCPRLALAETWIKLKPVRVIHLREAIDAEPADWENLLKELRPPSESDLIDLRRRLDFDEPDQRLFVSALLRRLVDLGRSIPSRWSNG